MSRGYGAVYVISDGLLRTISAALTPDEARDLIRDLELRQVRNELAPRLNGGSREAAMEAGQALAAAIKDVQDRPVGEVRVRRGWIGPPFTYHWAYVAEARPPGASRPETYRIRRGLATEVSRVWWYVPLF